MKNETGIYTGVSREEYDLIDRMNFSVLTHMKKSPAHCLAAQMGKLKKDTDAMRFGRALHVATLEPEQFRSHWAVWDGGDRRGKLWEAFKAKAATAGLEILKQDEYESVMAIASRVHSDEHAARYFRNGSAEVTALWTHTQPGVGGFEVQCKGRMDFLTGEIEAIVDLKSTKDASPEAFAKQCWNLDYAARAAFYVDGEATARGGAPLPYVLAAVEKDEPYVVQVYTVPVHILDMGRDVYRGHLARLAQCRRENRWSGYATGPLELGLPNWMQKDDATGMGLVFEGENANG